MSKFSIGDEVEVIESITESDNEIRAGQKMVVEDYVPAEESEDGKAFYWLNHQNGYNNRNRWALESNLNLVASASEVSKRTVPTIEAIAKSIKIDPWGGDFSWDSIEPCGEGRVGITGRTSDGLEFVTEVQVLYVERALY